MLRQVTTKLARALRSKKASEAAFLPEAIYKKGIVYRYPKVFQSNNGYKFKSNVTKLLKKHNVDVRRATSK